MFYTWLSLILSTNRHRKNGCPALYAAQSRATVRATTSWETFALIYSRLAQQVPVQPLFSCCSRSYTRNSFRREGHLKPNTGGNGQTPSCSRPTRVLVCLVDKLSAEAWCERRKPAETEQYRRVILTLLHEIVKRMIDDLFSIFIFSHNINTV